MADRRSEDEAAAARVERVRGYRVREERAGIGDEVARAARAVRRRSDAEERAAEAWEAVVPDEFRGRAAFVACRRGVVTVRASDAGVRYRLEAWVRAGGLRTLAAVARTAVSRVRVVV